MLSGDPGRLGVYHRHGKNLSENSGAKYSTENLEGGDMYGDVHFRAADPEIEIDNSVWGFHEGGGRKTVDSGVTNCQLLAQAPIASKEGGGSSTQVAAACEQTAATIRRMFDDAWFVFKDYVVWCKRRLALLVFGSATCCMVPFVSVRLRCSLEEG